MEYRAMIDSVTVRSSYPVIVYGSVRGLVSRHRTISGAARSLRRDQDGCERQGGYSDAYIYEWSPEEGWSPHSIFDDTDW
jgi:hypothetical protein